MRLKNLDAARDDVLECRSMGHAWTHLNDAEFERRRGEIVRFVRTEECTRCGTQRWREVDLVVGMITRRGTRYADGYLLEKGSVKPTRVDALRAMYRR